MSNVELRDPFATRDDMSWDPAQVAEFDRQLLKDLLDPFTVSAAGDGSFDHSAADWLLFDDLKDPFVHEVTSSRIDAIWDESLRDPFSPASATVFDRPPLCPPGNETGRCAAGRTRGLQDPFNSQ